MPVGEEADDRRSMQGTSVFCVSMFQYITLAIIYSKGHPYRKPLFANKPLCASLVGLFVVSAWIAVLPPDWLIHWLEFDPIPFLEDRLLLLVLGVLSGVLSYLYETFVIDHFILGVRERRLKQHQLLNESEGGAGASCRFERILLRIGQEPNWIRVKAGGSVSAPALFRPLDGGVNRRQSGMGVANGPSALDSKRGSGVDSNSIRVAVGSKADGDEGPKFELSPSTTQTTGSIGRHSPEAEIIDEQAVQEGRNKIEGGKDGTEGL